MSDQSKEHEDSADPLIRALRGDSSADGKLHPLEGKLADEMLDHHRQRRIHKRWLFWGTAIIFLVMWGFFIYFLVFCERLKELLTITPLSLLPVGMLGVIPTIGIIMMFKCVFRPSSKEKAWGKSDLEAIKEILSVFKSLN